MPRRRRTILTSSFYITGTLLSRVTIIIAANTKKKNNKCDILYFGTDVSKVPTDRSRRFLSDFTIIITGLVKIMLTLMDQ